MTKIQVQAAIAALLVSVCGMTIASAKSPAEMCKETITKMAVLDAKRSAPLLADKAMLDKAIAKKKKRYLTPGAIEACSKRVREDVYACKVKAETMRAFRQCERR